MVVSGRELEILGSEFPLLYIMGLAGEAGRGEIGKNNLLEVRRSRNREARMLNGSSMELLKASRMIQK